MAAVRRLAVTAYGRRSTKDARRGIGRLVEWFEKRGTSSRLSRPSGRRGEAVNDKPRLGLSARCGRRATHAFVRRHDRGKPWARGGT